MEDFEPGPFTVDFSVGVPLPAFSCITLRTVDDDNIEGDHDFQLEIVSNSLPNSVSTFLPSHETVVIYDNDGM